MAAGLQGFLFLGTIIFVKRVLLLCVVLLWVGIVSLGTYYLMSYANTPGESALPPTIWPANSSIPRSKDTPTLVLFGHPECPCTMASVYELNSLMTHVKEHLKVYVLFVIPTNEMARWRASALEAEAKAIPGVTILIDENGREASQFDAKTSGQVMLYDESGQLQFSGGITSARGHAADNLGKSAVVSFVIRRSGITRSTPVFGCALYTQDERKYNDKN